MTSVIVLIVNEACNCTTQITETNVHRDAYAALRAATDVVAIPCYTLGHVAVDTGGRKEGAGILNAEVILVRREQHDEADDGADIVADHEQATGAEFVCCEAAADAENGRDDVGGHGHQLSEFRVSVTEILDDGWEEDTGKAG